MIRFRFLLLSGLFTVLFLTGFSQVHTSYLWHLQQPIYWPAQSLEDSLTYQKVRESQWLKVNAGQVHPENDLQSIFNNDDRKAVYQYRAKDAVQSLLSLPEAGAQVNYSGCLMQNVNSLAAANQWGYSTNWQNNFINARTWSTSGGKPRMDIVGFTMHHALSPLLSERVLRKQIQAHRYIYQQNFGNNPVYSKGYWPAECAFSERIIKVLVEEGFEWSIIANSHLARTLQDYPLNFGTSGCNLDPPNPADKVPALGVNWWSGQIDGRGGNFAAPYCYQAHIAKYVDPEIGQEYSITVVPMADLLSYKNGYATLGTGDIDSHIAPFENASHPSLVLFAHDGDNAWGGGYDYYTNSVPNLANACAAQGYVPTTIEQFLSDHPVPSSDVVHVEDGSWINPANDWGHPQFINWLWPMYTSNQVFDPNGWTEDARNWAVLVAAENLVSMAEDIVPSNGISNVVDPQNYTDFTDRAWNYLLPAYTSGYMYYGTSLDMEVKPTIACNKAVEMALHVILPWSGIDQTPPSVFIPQRFPYNPGGTGFGPVYGYQQVNNPSDFTIWTFAFDFSGIQNVSLKYRVDFNGINPLTDNQNETYAGGNDVGNWMSLAMTERNFPAGNVSGNPEIDFFEMPQYIANEYYAEISGLSDTLVDYYVEVSDIYGNITKTAIQHVYVGAETGTNPLQGVSWEPQNPGPNDTITITVHNAVDGALLHWGVNYTAGSWTSPDPVYWPAGTSLFNGGPAAQSSMTGPDANNDLTIQIGPFNQPDQVVESVAFVIHYNNGNWDNNGGQDYHIVLNTDPVHVAELRPEGMKLLAYPNPAKDFVQIQLKAADKKSQGMLRVYNHLAQLVFVENNFNGSIRLNTESLLSGIYTTQVIDKESSKSYNVRFVVQ